MNSFLLKILRIVFIIILVASAAVSAVFMSPLLLLLWWMWEQNERGAAEAVRNALAKRAQA